MSAGPVGNNSKLEVIRIIVQIQMRPGICLTGGLNFQIRPNSSTTNENNRRNNKKQLAQKSHSVPPWKDKAQEKSCGVQIQQFSVVIIKLWISFKLDVSDNEFDITVSIIGIYLRLIGNIEVLTLEQLLLQFSEPETDTTNSGCAVGYHKL